MTTDQIERYLPRALVALACLLAGFLLVALTLATSHAACVDDPANGVCCAPAPCNVDPNFGAYEIKRQVGPIPYPIVSERFVGTATLGTIRRLLVPDAPAAPGHLTAFEVSGVPGQNGAAFHAVTSAGDWTMKLRAARWVLTNATKAIPPALPPAAGILPAYVCYGADTVRDAATGKPVPRFTATWTDQFGSQVGDFGSQYTVCFPANGTTAKPLLCLGDGLNVPPGPVNINFDTPVTLTQLNVNVDPLDDICLRVQS